MRRGVDRMCSVVFDEMVDAHLFILLHDKLIVKGQYRITPEKDENGKTHWRVYYMLRGY